MRRHRTSGFLFVLGVGGFAVPASAQSYQGLPAQGRSAASTTAPAATGTESALLQALQANPITAPYRFATETRGTKVALRGRVGSKQAHDAAIQTAIAMGVPVVDDLVIDTAEAYRVAAPVAGYAPAAGDYGAVGFGYGPPALGPGLGYVSRRVGFGYGYGPSPFANYPSLFGLVGDPFYGFDPPAISYPPWWGELSAQRLATSPMAPDAGAPTPVDPSQVGVGANAPAGPATGAIANPDPNAKPGDVPIEMTIDPRGVATIRGTVPTLADRIEVGQRLARTPGVAEVVNLLTVRAPTPNAPGRADQPPPPPTPAGPSDSARPPTITSEPAINPEANANSKDADPVARRAAKALVDRPALANQGAQVKVRDGVATLSGTVPTAYEAMLAYRAVQQTPGVREVDDRLGFAVPDENNPNPLAEKGRPEDVEPYLAAQVRRQVGDLAHVDSVRARGGSLEIRGTLGREEDRGRLDAILRSMPLLRGFKVESSFGSSPP